MKVSYARVKIKRERKLREEIEKELNKKDIREGGGRDSRKGRGKWGEVEGFCLSQGMKIT